MESEVKVEKSKQRDVKTKQKINPQTSEFAYGFLRLLVSFCQPCVDAYSVAICQNSEVQV